MKTMLFNPYTGKPRDPRDIASDPSGVLMLDPDEPLRAAVALEPQGQALPDDRLKLISNGDPAWLLEHVKENSVFDADLLADVFRLAKERTSQLALPAGPVPADAAHVQAARKALAELREAVEGCANALQEGEGFDEAWEKVTQAEGQAHKWLLIDVGNVPARLRAIKNEQASPSPAVAQPAEQWELAEKQIAKAWREAAVHSVVIENACVPGKFTLAHVPGSGYVVGVPSGDTIGFQQEGTPIAELLGALLAAQEAVAQPVADEREAFENSARSLGVYACHFERFTADEAEHFNAQEEKAGNLRRASEGDYRSNVLRDCWKVWQARAALCQPAEEGDKA